jgi:hypothetical protein
MGSRFRAELGLLNCINCNPNLNQKIKTENMTTLHLRKSKIAQQQQQIEALAAGLQKVSAAVELNKPAVTQVADTR